ncbi:MAG TPA: peptidoglycan DD-metalloendopeptidase family protein [Vicinamibacteria bacterium]|nr:peptidoglycan DD-metalloendopeptidase family protein [Vicinamibacteria bacterium]
MSPQLLLALVLLLPQQAPESAAPAAAAAAPDLQQQQLARVRERRAVLEKELLRLRRKEKGLLAELEGIELELQLRSDELAEIQLTLKKARVELDANLLRVQELEASLAASRPALAAHARALYKLGDMSYLRLLLSVDRPSDFFRAYRFVSTLARRDTAGVAAFRADLLALEREKAALEQRTRESIELRNRLAATRHQLEAQRARQTAVLTSLVEKKETNTAWLDELTQAESRLQSLLGGLGTDPSAMPLLAFRGTLPWPVEGRVRAGFGRRKHPRFDTYTVHNGIDIEASPDTPVHAVHEGRVVFADRFLGYGLMVVVDHGGKRHSLYAQLAEVAVAAGQEVQAGTVLGTTGQGTDQGPGLYFEMRFQGRAEDPLEWLRRP